MLQEELNKRSKGSFLSHGGGSKADTKGFEYSLRLENSLKQQTEFHRSESERN